MEDQGAIDSKMKELISLYFEVKKLVIASENATRGNRLSIPAINELRNANDHLLRAFAVSYGVTPPPQEWKRPPVEYCVKNIDKAIGHVYRAGYDALDIIAMGLTEGILSDFGGFSMATRVGVFADYARDIRIPLQKAAAICDEAKTLKDVEVFDTAREFFVGYKNVIEMLKSVRDLIDSRMPELVVVEAEAKAAEERHRRHAIKMHAIWTVIGIVAAILIAIAIWYIPPHH